MRVPDAPPTSFRPGPVVQAGGASFDRLMADFHAMVEQFLAFLDRARPQPPAAPVPAGVPLPAPQAPAAVTSAPSASGRTIPVPAGGNLQAALDAAQPGDTLVLEAGATYVGPFKLPAKPGESYITIATSAPGGLPADGQRVSPAHAAAMPKILSPGRGEPAIFTEPGAHHFRFVGIEVAQQGDDMLYDLIRLGDGSSAQNSLDQVPHHMVFDRSYIHASPNGEAKRGIALNSAHTEILNSHISGFKGKGYDTQAISGWNGPGPFRIVNNYLEGAGENILFGGADPAIANLVPSDIEIRGNHFHKPVEWRGNWTVKNLFELKNARRVTVDGNLFENNWGDAQNGFAILFTVRNQDGRAPWSTVSDVSFTNNVVRRSGSGINILGQDDLQPSAQAERILVANNRFEEIDGDAWNGQGIFLQATAMQGLTVDHNTVNQSGNVASLYGKPSSGVTFSNNVLSHNQYGVFGDAVGSGNPAIARYWPGAVFQGNVIAKADPNQYPGGNSYPGALEGAEGAPTTDGRRPGADQATIPFR